MGIAVDKVPAPERFKLPRTPLMFDPGERWQYGTSIDWVGRIVESISDEPLEAHFKKYIFEPLGMKDTTFEITAAQRTREASGHHRQPDGSLKAEPMEPAPKPHAPRPAPFGRRRHLFDRAGLSDADPHAHAWRRARRRAHPAARNGRAHGPESDRPGRSRHSENHGPQVSNDVDFFHGISLKWGFGHMINMQPVPEARSAGSMTWAGLYNTYYWIDPKKRVAAVFMTQVLPFADERALRVYRQFERGIYAAVKTG